MARRPDPAEFDRPLSKPELAERHRRLSMLSPHHVADAYRKAFDECRDGRRQIAESKRHSGTGNRVETPMGLEK
jgi:hypothetical protein